MAAWRWPFSWAVTSAAVAASALVMTLSTVALMSWTPVPAEEIVDRKPARIFWYSASERVLLSLAKLTAPKALAATLVRRVGL